MTKDFTNYLAKQHQPTNLPHEMLSKGKQSLVEGDSLPWVEKYRPDKLDQLISHGDIISTISKFIDEKKLPHLLLYGPPGTGKTSLILAMAKRIYGEGYKNMILELNASDDRGIEVVRQQIITFASTKQIFSTGVKLVILDEADSMTTPAQAALRRVMEKYTSNVRFCIICNYVGKIIPAIQSRCTRFRFAPLGIDQMIGRLRVIFETESINISKDGEDAVLRLSKGDMRRALNILQSTHSAFGVVNEANVYACTGNPLPTDIGQIVSWMLEKDYSESLAAVSELKLVKGLALQDLITEIYDYINDIQFPRDCKIFLLHHLSEIEYRLSSGCDEKIQLNSLIGTWQLSKEIAAKAM